MECYIELIIRKFNYLSKKRMTKNYNLQFYIFFDEKHNMWIRSIENKNKEIKVFINLLVTFTKYSILLNKYSIKIFIIYWINLKIIVKTY